MEINFDYHDTPIENITFDFLKKSIAIYLSKYNDELDLYSTQQLKFKQVKIINFPISIDNEIEPEIFSFEIAHKQNSKESTF